MQMWIIFCAALGFGLISMAIVARGDQQLRTHQDMIHEHGAGVMPFDLDKTVHIFTKTKVGGVQAVVVRDASDAKNLALIRMHLRMEADNFATGDFSDPAALHGEGMPGISVLQANYEKMKVTYLELSNGAKITYESSDAETISAIHQWFDAQVKDHGQDAIAR